MKSTKGPEHTRGARDAGAVDVVGASVGHEIGVAGELHQQTNDRDRALTTNQGTPIADDQTSLRAGRRGPTLLEDFVLREKITHFDHERIPDGSFMRAARERTAISRLTDRCLG